MFRLLAAQRCGLRSAHVTRMRRTLATALVNSIGDSESWDAFVSSGKGPMVGYYTAAWCGPCQAIAPVFQSLAEENPEVRFAKIDIDDAQDLAADMAIRSVPTFFFYNSEGNVVSSFAGADAGALKESVDSLRGL